ncbi:MAG: response regulator [Betaproteobacteria bacterium]|nr:response regulator [Betaproteobacteria bacterium]
MNAPAPRTRLMLVEDERIVATNLRLRLDQLGYEVSAVASSGEEALSHAHESWPDLILMDIRIEGEIDGIETAERLNRIRPVPVIYLTAHSDEGTLARARSSSPFGYLLKPFSEREMHATIQMALARFEAQETLRASRDEVRRLADELDQRVPERTRELEESLEDLSGFAHAVAHDLRSPLQSIYGIASLLQADHAAQLPPEGQRHVERIAEVSMHMSRMMNGLLALARIARAPFARREVDLCVFVRETARELAERDPARQVDWVIAPSVVAQADPNAAEVAIENLVQNAWKFTANRPRARIEFGVRRFTDETIFFVSDDGVGFDMAQANRLFQPFGRLHKPGEFPGDGIGLATVRRIVERHAGRIWAESQPDRGTTVYFTLAPATPVASLGGLPN